jgi:hypothetical protein
MEVFLNEGNGITLRTVTEPKGEYLIATDELKSKFKNFVRPKLDFENNDIIESAKESELQFEPIKEDAPAEIIEFIETLKQRYNL